MDGDLTKKVNEIMANPEFQSLVRELRGGEEMPDASEVSAKLPEVLSAFGPVSYTHLTLPTILLV